MTVVRSEKENVLKKAVILVLLPSRRTLMLVDNLCINIHELLYIYTTANVFTPCFRMSLVLSFVGGREPEGFQ